MNGENDEFNIKLGAENTKLEYLPNTNYLYAKARISCPNCSRIASVVRFKTDEPKEVKDIRCKQCPIAGFDWKYEPQKLGDKYVRINSSASVSTDNIAKFLIFNERNFKKFK